MTLDEAKRVIRYQIAEIKRDERFRYPPALVQVNAPLALIQTEMAAKIVAYEFALQVLDGIGADASDIRRASHERRGR